MEITPYGISGEEYYKIGAGTKGFTFHIYAAFLAAYSTSRSNSVYMETIS